MSHEFIELEQATSAVLDILKTISELRHTKVAVIGGMALWKYLPEYRTTQDVDFCITAIGAPGTVKAKLLNLPKSPFKQAADVFMYVQGKQQIQIDFVNTMQLLYLSAAAVEVKDIPAGSVPYISVADLVVYKSFSCGLRPTDQKETRDADDAWFLLNGEQEELQLSAEHKSIIKPFMLEDVIKYGSDETDAAWWNSKLGL